MAKTTTYDFTVTCHTEGCSNGEIAIDAPALEAEPIFICGVCSVEITDIIAR